MQPHCTTPHLDEILTRREGAYSDFTIRGYRSDLQQFIAWCELNGFSWLPASPEALASFVDREAADKATATIKRRVVAIEFAHRIANLPAPTTHSLVRLALRRAGRAKPRRPKQVQGLTVELLYQMIAACPKTLAGARDAALLSVGYDSLCRSSELAAMQMRHVSRDLARIRVPRSKADQFGDGRIAYLSPNTSQLLINWIHLAGLSDGPLFRGLHTGKLGSTPLSTASIRRIVKRAAKRADLDAEVARELSGHSMRVGAAQDMMVAGFDAIGIMQAGGWRTYSVVGRYVENAAAERLHMRRWERVISR